MLWKQLCLLLWKNYILRKRHLLRTAIEVVWPLLLFLILVAIRVTQPIENDHECHYPARAMPSAGVYPWLKSLMCDIQSPCFETPISSEVPGQLNFANSNSDLLSALAKLDTLLTLSSDPTKLADGLPNLLTDGLFLHDDKSRKEFFHLLNYIQNVSSSSSNFSEVYTKFCGHPLLTNIEASGFFRKQSSNSSTLNITALLQSSSFCSDVKEIFENNTEYKLIWQVVKPLWLGKIPYSPNTSLVKSIIAHANQTFETLANLKSFGESWQSSIGPNLYKNLDKGSYMTVLRESLNQEAELEKLSRKYNVSIVSLKQLRDFLSNEDNPNDSIITWKDLYKKVNNGIVLTTKILQCAVLDKFQAFNNEQELVEYSLGLVKSNNLWGSLVFVNPNETDNVLPKVVKYKLRQNAGAVTGTTAIERYFWRPGAENGLKKVKYYISGFVHIQDIIENAIVDTFASYFDNPSPAVFGRYLQQMPYPCYTRDRFLEYMPGLLPLLMSLAWIYSVCIIIKNIVYEKEKRLKEVMKMMGLSNGVHWVAWFINSFLVMVCSIVLLIIILKVSKVIAYSNSFIVFLWLSSFACATITQCFLISCFFSKANLAAACGGIIYFVLYIPYNMMYTFEDQMTLSAKLVACLLSTVSFGYGATYLSRFEMSGDGVQFSSWNTSPDPSNQLTFLHTIVMMVVDSVIYMTLTWYIESVFPGTYGVPRPWYFFLTKSYWRGSSTGKSRNLSESSDASDSNIKLEAEPKHLSLGVSIHRLRKVYNNGKVAVDDLSLNFYEGQITSFLGHNGAGKTTTMSMLTGLFTPTAGTAHIYGNDIHSDIDQIRHRLGFCPQHNVLFGDLTVLEHLKLYTGLKCASGGVAMNNDETEQMLIDVGLADKRDIITRHLSGGMKRKLSVGIAFVGDSKCVILDEPTAGVDPYARRAIWDLLLRYRNNRTILLSTHHMDEADLLGDRIAIISHGKLRCCGSSIFLKSCFGVGYYLTIVKNGVENASPPSEVTSETSERSCLLGDSDEELLQLSSNEILSPPDIAEGSDEGFGSYANSESPSSLFGQGLSKTSKMTLNPVRPGCSSVLDTDTSVAQEAIISDLVFNIIPKAKIQEENAKEITFVLPYSDQTNGRYSSLLSKLDENHLTYGLADTSLEEIFLNVAENNEEEGKEETTKSCFCIPRRKKSSGTETTDAQARFGRRRRLTTRSICSLVSDNAENPLIPRTNMGFVNDDTEGNVFSTIGEADDGSRGKGSYKVAGKSLVLQQFRALFIKRFHNARRNKKGIVAQMIAPPLLVALALTFALIVPVVKNDPPLELQPWMYGTTNTFFSNDMPQNSRSTAVINALLNDPGIGMKCVNQYSVRNYDGTFILCNKSKEQQKWVSPAADIKGFSRKVSSNETAMCSCTSNYSRVLLANCPEGAGGEATPHSLTHTSDWMYNMTGRNVSDWLVKTVDRFLHKRYGGLSVGEKSFSNQTVKLLTKLIKQAIAQSKLTPDTFENKAMSLAGLTQRIIRTENDKVWFTRNGYHSMPTWLNILNNAALRSKLPATENPTDYGIVAINHPLNFTQSSADIASLIPKLKSMFISISVIFALSFIPASFVLLLIEEKVTKSQHLQFVSGVNQLVYWTTNFIWDLINYTFPVIVVLVVFFAFQTKAFVSADNFPCLVSLLILYGFSVTPMMYPASFYFEVPSTAYVVLTCVNLFIGINTTVATVIMEYLHDANLLDVDNRYLKRAFLVFPQYCLGRGLLDMSVNQAVADVYSSFGVEKFNPPFSLDLVGKNLIAMAIQGTIFFILTLLIQYRFFFKPRSGVKSLETISSDAGGDQDEDVTAERRRLLEGGANDILQIKNLTKVYSSRWTKGNDLVAVNRLCVGVPEGECFGLLGVNGAGKTTTFKMLTGDTLPTAGDAQICGQSILDNIRHVQQNTGYCPQFEALCSLLTGREHLALYAKLRGVPPEDTESVVNWAIEKFGLKAYANKCAGTYSGGNKRKLSAAIAFIGCPPIVFLDEPTAGMDPVARRFLWGRIAEVVRGGRCIVLTSHSMEECEALCTKLAIMVNGQLKCIGSPQHLKNRYGEGYTITIKVRGSNPDVMEVKRFIESSFLCAVLKEHHYNMLMYQLPLDGVKLADLFAVMEGGKDAMKIDDYSVSQTTLDEVFVNFAKNQTDGSQHIGISRPGSDLSDENSVEIDDDDDVPLLGFQNNGRMVGSDYVAMHSINLFDTNRDDHILA